MKKSDKKGEFRFIRFLIIVCIIIVVLLIGVLIFLYLMESFEKNSFGYSKNKQIVLENPLKDIIVANTNNGLVNQTAVVQQGIIQFNEEYINFILIGIGISSLYKSLLFGNPIIELQIDNEAWNSEITKGTLVTKKGAIDKKDLKIIMTKEEAVKALLSSNIEQFMKESVSSGRTKIETIAGKTELFSKGYLDMYNKLSK